jgi:antitoxin component of RelBE/YafQ-DinJ toxin-antitoxin module
VKGAFMKTDVKVPYISVRIEQEVKNKLQDLAKTKGMDLSKLSRAVLTNFVSPNTYTL